jgi:predicted nucleotidyltransferase component of viral defense system
MLPRDQILAWRDVAPWPDEGDVEQDLVITRAIFDIFADPWLADRLAFRGGTALHRLFLAPAARYSEDIDLVQRHPEPIGPTIDRLRARLAWIGKANSEIGQHPKVRFRFVTDGGSDRKLKVEINTREQFGNVVTVDFAVESRVFSGTAEIPSYHLDELLGTKLRALYQRRKGRDLFDLWWAHERRGIDPTAIVEHFRRYMSAGDQRIPTAIEFRSNLDGKRRSAVFEEVRPLLRADIRYDASRALAWFEATFMPLFDGDDGVRLFADDAHVPHDLGAV